MFVDLISDCNLGNPSVLTVEMICPDGSKATKHVVDLEVRRVSGIDALILEIAVINFTHEVGDT